MEAKEPARWIWWANWLGIAIGVVALGFILDELGWSRILTTLRDARDAIAIAFALGVLAVLLRARALHLALRPSMRMVHYGRVVAAHVSLNELRAGLKTSPASHLRATQRLPKSFWSSCAG